MKPQIKIRKNESIKSIVIRAKSRLSEHPDKADIHNNLTNYLLDSYLAKTTQDLDAIKNELLTYLNNYLTIEQ